MAKISTRNSRAISLPWNSALRDKSDLALLRKLHASGVPVVAVFLSGRPLWVNAEINASDAFVAAFLPGSEGGGIADVLFKAPSGAVRYDFHGKLSFSWPRTPYQSVAFLGKSAGSGESPLFPLGYGLRYGDDGDLKALSEEAGTPKVATVDTRVFFAKGKAGAGWSWFAGEGTAHELPLGIGWNDDYISVAATDKSAQEDARIIRWSGTGPAWVGLSGNTSIDLQREANGQLSLGLDYKVDSPDHQQSRPDDGLRNRVPWSHSGSARPCPRRRSGNGRT